MSLAQQAGDLRRELAALKEKEQPRASPRAGGTGGTRTYAWVAVELSSAKTELTKMKQLEKYAAARVYAEQGGDVCTQVSGTGKLSVRHLMELTMFQTYAFQNI